MSSILIIVPRLIHPDQNTKKEFFKTGILKISSNNEKSASANGINRRSEGQEFRRGEQRGGNRDRINSGISRSKSQKREDGDNKGIKTYERTRTSRRAVGDSRNSSDRDERSRTSRRQTSGQVEETEDRHRISRLCSGQTSGLLENRNRPGLDVKEAGKVKRAENINDSSKSFYVEKVNMKFGKNISTGSEIKVASMIKADEKQFKIIESAAKNISLPLKAKLESETKEYRSAHEDKEMKNIKTGKEEPKFDTIPEDAKDLNAISPHYVENNIGMQNNNYAASNETIEDVEDCSEEADGGSIGDEVTGQIERINRDRGKITSKLEQLEVCVIGLHHIRSYLHVLTWMNIS